jgi:hypothetical protein
MTTGSQLAVAELETPSAAATWRMTTEWKAVKWRPHRMRVESREMATAPYELVSELGRDSYASNKEEGEPEDDVNGE